MGRVMKFTISCLLTLQMLQIKYNLDWPSSSWEGDVNARRMTTHSNRSPELLQWSKNRMSFMFNVFKLLFIYTMDNFSPSFDSNKSPKLHRFNWNNNTKQSIWFKPLFCHVSLESIKRQLIPRHFIVIRQDKKVTRFNLCIRFRKIL